MATHPQELYDRTAGRYDFRHGNATTRHLRNRETKVLCKRAKGRVLDIGCGTGVYAGLSTEYVGIDIAPAMAKTAHMAQGKPVLVARAEDLPFRDQSFDTVLCMFTVLNLCDQAAAVAEMARVLRPGGTIVLSVASVWDKKSYPLHRKVRGRFDHDATAKSMRIEGNRFRFMLFEKQQLLDLMLTHGFRPVEFHGVYKWQDPRWNRHLEFTRWEKAKLQLERVLLPSATGRIYLAAFRKR